jgi:hypothetical protein
MSERSTHVIPLAGGCLAALLLLIWLVARDGWAGGDPAPARPAPEAVAPGPTGHAPGRQQIPANVDRNPKPPAIPLLAALRRLPNVTGARPHEAVLTFANAEAYRRFLARAAQLGLTILGRLDALFTVRVRYDSLDGLQGDLLANAGDYAGIDANFYVSVPTTPPKQDRPAQNLVPVGNATLAVLGVTGDHSRWGAGITIAVLDSGVAPDSTFGTGRLRSLDIGLGTAAGSGPEGGHGTAVAALAAGAAPDAPGVAPAADVLSIRVTDASAQSDVFTIAQAILAATDAGAQIINISLGGYETSPALTQAIDYANQRGAVVVASAGNDQAAQLTWPAADPSVISVGATDALGQQVYFSNAGAELKLTAPGYGVQTAWLDGQRVYFDGTSASAPLAAGAIAALMSTNPGMSAAQAAQVLEQYASDGGAPGPDPNFGNGVVNLAWAMNRNSPLYVDTAISSHYYDPTAGQMEFVIQNRSGQGIGGMVLSVDAGGTTTTYSIPLLGPGASYVAAMAVDPNELKAGSGLVFRTQLANPGGVTDQVPANNRRTSVLAPPTQ